ncbi:hypothetical protein RRG08_042466 [Elysia crispata]|uniref:Uncharacterized protein n=1 Tax=Elysia crispata TaxID=231223 RepID=A0AAE0ZC28_9GAST|nr:hypothetical protein RRG08_042466 [Elysia crispata]
MNFQWVVEPVLHPVESPSVSSDEIMLSFTCEITPPQAEHAHRSCLYDPVHVLTPRPANQPTKSIRVLTLRLALGSIGMPGHKGRAARHDAPAYTGVAGQGQAIINLPKFSYEARVNSDMAVEGGNGAKTSRFG